MNIQEKILENGGKKGEALAMINRLLLIRVPLVPVAIIFVIISKFIFRPFSNFYLVSALIAGASLLIFPVIYLIKKSERLLSHRTIYLIIAAEFSVESILVFFIFFLWAPIITYYIGGGIIFILALVYMLTTITSNPIFNNKSYSYFFFISTLLLIVIFGVLEYFGIHPNYSSYPTKDIYLSHQIKSVFLALTMAGVLFFIIQSRLEEFWNMFRRQTKELKLLNAELEKKVQERTKEIENAKSVLEVRVQARTRELKELADSLENQVKERTQELQERINELERFHQLTVGRELKMIELKDRIKELEEKLRNLKQ